MRYFFLVALLVSLASCKFHEPEFRGEEKFEVKKMDGQTITLNAGGKVYNGNWFGIKLKPSILDLYVNGDYVGKVHLEKKVKMKAKRETMLEAPLTAHLEKGTLMKLMAAGMKSEVTLRFKGKVKGGVFIFSKKFEVDETKKISGKSLRP